MFGMEGNVVGIVGSGFEGNGGNVTFGAAGIGGRVGSFGSVGWFGRVGRGGSVAWGNVGIDGIGGNATFGIGGSACKRWRAAMLISKLDDDNAIIMESRKQCLRAAMFLEGNIGESSKFFYF